MTEHMQLPTWADSEAGPREEPPKPPHAGSGSGCEQTMLGPGFTTGSSRRGVSVTPPPTSVVTSAAPASSLGVVVAKLLTVDLDPVQLEVVATKTLTDALQPTGLGVWHNGSRSQHAPGGKPDIEVFDKDFHVIVEVTKLTASSQANSEATPVVAHLQDIQVKHKKKKCIAIFVSPVTSGRTINLFQTHNKVHGSADGGNIACINFNTFNLVMGWLEGPDGRTWTAKNLVDLMDSVADCSSDADILEKLNSNALKMVRLESELARIREARLGAKYEKLDSIFKGIHKDLRSVCGLAPPEAFYELSKLVFLKMHEEQRVVEQERRGVRVLESRFTTEYIQQTRLNRPPEEEARHPIIQLFESVRRQHEGSGLFDAHETLNIQPDLDEGSYVDSIVSKIEDLRFIDPDSPSVDVKGLIYEQFLGLSLKNTDLGQFFTPEAVVDFVVRAAELKPDDTVLDPACGTGRFLVHAMNKMLDAAEDDDQRSRIKEELLLGGELSPQVAKIAKMNMFVHGDGRTNVQHRESLQYDPPSRKRPSVILTNPPLGDVNFKQLVGAYDSHVTWYERMAVIRKDEKQPRGKAVKRSVPGRMLKGGALFLEKFSHWTDHGARVITVIDDAVLNTDEYAESRRLIRSRFTVEAVISLTPDAFKHASKTSTKTSLILLRRKAPVAEATTAQELPVLFAHANNVGIDPRGRRCANDLIDDTREDDLLRVLERFREAVRRATNADGVFNPDAFEFASGTLENLPSGAESDYSFFPVYLEETGEERLEYKWHDRTYRNVVEKITDNVDLLSLVQPDATNYGLTATGQPAGELPFINIENLGQDGRVSLSGIRYVPSEMQADVAENNITKADDLLISRSRIPGIACVVAPYAENFAFGSYIIRFRFTDEALKDFLPQYVALSINSVLGQTQVYRLKSGSNGYNINARQLEKLLIPRIGLDEQRRIVAKHMRRLKVLDQLSTIARSMQDDGEWDLAAASLKVESESADPDKLQQAVENFGSVVDEEVAPTKTASDLAPIAAVRARLRVRSSFSKSMSFGDSLPDA